MACYRVFVDGRVQDIHRVSVGIETEKASVLVDRNEAQRGPGSESTLLGFIAQCDGIVKLPKEHPDCAPCDEATFGRILDVLLGQHARCLLCRVTPEKD